MWSWSEIQRAWPRRTLPEAAYQGKIEAFERAPRLYGGQQRPVTVRVTNAGTEHWPGLNREPWIKLSHRWLAPKGPAPAAWTDTCLPASLAPGASALVPVAIEAPVSAGRHTLELELVHEDLLRGDVLRRFAAVSLPIDVEAAERNPWERPVPAGRSGRLRRSLWRPRRASRVEGVARLTFDDGPSDWTEPLLEILRRYSIRATFFVIGRKARQRPELRAGGGARRPRDRQPHRGPCRAAPAGRRCGDRGEPAANERSHRGAHRAKAAPVPGHRGD